MLRSLFISLALALALGGCSHNAPPIGGPGVVVANADELPAPTSRDAYENAKPYLIGPLDKLRIDVFGVAELSNRELQVDAGGNVSFPLAGEFVATGKQPAELAREIEGRLAGQFIRDPQVTVNVAEIVSQQLTVDGEVLKPGLYPILGKMTLERAIAYAGGLSEYAKLDDVVVLRTANGQKYAAIYNLGAIRRGNYKDPEVFANDMVIVGNSRARRFFKDLLQSAPLLTTPLVLLLQ